MRITFWRESVTCLIEAPTRNKLLGITFLLLDVSQMLALYHFSSESIEQPAEAILRPPTVNFLSLLPLCSVSLGS